MLLCSSRRKFSQLYSLFGLLSPSSAGLRVGSFPPAREIPEHVPMERDSAGTKVQVTTLDNGVRILTESADFPSAVTFAVCVGAGPRDEDLEHAGITLALKNTFLKTNTRTNEQLNYCMIQMGGGGFSMTYDQEAMLYAGRCLAHDTYDFLQMTADVVLDDKTVVDEEAAQWRADEYFKLRDLNKTHATVIEDNWLTVAYGLKGLGMPLAGFQSKFQSIGYSHLNHFREHYATPDRMIVMGAGRMHRTVSSLLQAGMSGTSCSVERLRGEPQRCINHHEEFVTAVKPYFQYLLPKKAHPRAPSKYLGGEMRVCSEDPLTTIHLSFHGPPAGADSIFPLIVLRTLVGESSARAAPSLCRCYSHFVQKYPFLSSAKFSYGGFTDSSNFGVNVCGPSESAGKLADALAAELKDLTNVTEEEVRRAKLRFQAWVANNFTSAEYRLYKYSMGMRFEGTPRTLPEIIAKSSAVTVDDVRATARSLLGTNPTLIVQGNVHDVPSADALHTRLQ